MYILFNMIKDIIKNNKYCISIEDNLILLHILFDFSFDKVFTMYIKL